MDKKLVSTGIEGLDEILNGGLINNRSILVQGDPGTGKSTLGTQFLVEGAKNNEPGVLVLMEYDIPDLISDMQAYGWPLSELIKQNKIKIISPPGGLENPDQVNLDDLINEIHSSVVDINAKRLVIDSLNSVELSLDTSSKLRKELIRFITLLRDLDCTTLLLSENSNHSENQVFQYVTHGLILLYNLKLGSNRQRAIEVLKMRGIEHSTLTHSMNIQRDKGIVVLPHEINLASNQL